MTPALVLRTRFADEMGKACCERIPRANADAVATAARVSLAVALPVKPVPDSAPCIERQMGLEIVRYAFKLFVYGRNWCGSGAAQDAELLNADNWRVTS